MISNYQLFMLTYLAVSLVTFGIYAMDKSAAKRGARRIPENTLHLLAFAGGWPGALVAQKVLRHKTLKTSFRIVFFLTVAANLLVVLALSKTLEMVTI
jgi:uncharacterized membrane protein YsdA (DUF1294 family)